MNFVVLDGETFWAQDYSLSMMTSESYIRNPRFKVHGWGVLPIGGRPRWLTHEQFQRFADVVDWSSTAVICQNTRFDGAILGWRYGIKPRLWIDTMGMYRALHPELKSHSLANLGKHFGFGMKGNELLNTKGKETLTPTEWLQLGVYCALGDDSDCRITERLFNAAWHRFPPFERAIMDMTLRMYIEPILEVEQNVLGEFLKKHVDEKINLLHRCGLNKSSVMSGELFAEALRQLGVEPPTKPSPSNPHKTIYAFAKTDEAMDELADHEDPQVQVLVAARLGNKSTLLETRTRHVMEIGRRGNLPIPLNYWGAKITGRHSGGDKLNMQNFTRGSVLRDGIVAPPGHKIVVGDSSNIELRLVMALSGQEDQVQLIRHYDSIPEDQRVTDLYCDFATDIYSRTITKKDKDERFVGKTGKLSLQYMASGNRFHEMVRQAVAKENAKERAKNPQWVNKKPLTPSEAERVKDVYRAKHRKVVSLWYYCDETIIPSIAERAVMRPVDVNGWFLTNGSGFSLPGELGVQYPGLAKTAVTVVGNHVVEQEWRYDSGRGLRNLYGAKVVENLCQHAARQVVMYQALLVGTRYRVVHSVHDELVCCVPEDEAEECAAFMLQCLSTAPKWAQGRLPVTGEVGIGDSYGEAK